MQNKKEIKELLEQFTSGEIGQTEKQQLFRFFNEPESKAFVYRWLKKKWKKLGDEELNMEVDFDQLLLRIHQDISTNQQVPVHPGKQQSKLIRIINASMRYAAVCLIACGIEWYILTQKGNPDHAQATVYNQIDVPYGSKSFIVLADSTRVWLNAGAKLHYPANFKGKDREVFLEGEAFFDVKKDKRQPFYVRMNGMSLKVHGTKFNVKAHKDDERIETTLLEGSVEVIGLKADRKSDQNLFLKPGQKLVLYKEQKEPQHAVPKARSDTAAIQTFPKILEPVKILDARLINLSATEPEVAWKKDKLIFERQRFDEVKVRLERWYGVTIEVRDSSVLDYRFTGTFEKETFEQAMHALKEAADFEYELHKKHVIIRKAG
jgi:ferric-dicitrate binding protein FerR (iron transport regulator)